jgi:hypothetical protein
MLGRENCVPSISINWYLKLGGHNSKNCPNLDAVKSSEKAAMNFKLGLWKLQGGGQRPWDYRKLKR